MARLVLNSEDASEKLQRFRIACGVCASERVTLDIDWAGFPSCSWNRIELSCSDCGNEEVLVDG